MSKILKINSLHRGNRVNPSASPNCLNNCRTFLFGGHDQVLKKNFEYPAIWDIKRKPVPRANGPPAEVYFIFNSPLAPGRDDQAIGEKNQWITVFLVLIKHHLTNEEVEMNFTKKLACVLAMLMLTMVMSPIAGLTRDMKGDTPFLVLKVDKVQLRINGRIAKNNPTLNTELVYRLDYSNYGMEAELMSFGFVTKGLKSRVGYTGNISVRFIPKLTKTSYNRKLNQITTKFEAEIHYPLIDEIRGFKQPGESKEEQDNFRSFTETASGVIVCRLDRRPDLKTNEKQRLRSKISMKIKIKDSVVGAIEYVELKKAELVGTVIWPWYFRKTINVQPVFVEYTPDTGCSLGGSVVSTGGSWEIAKEYAFDIWYRCCLRLKFLPPVYVSNDDWRILSSGEAGALRASYDDPNAVEIFFTENFDPIGTWGGGATWGSGTANTQIVTCDANLPINLYNVAHELGHSLNLMHPGDWPYNSTSGSLMEPSGFCMDNPDLMSQDNCDNISNPLIYWSLSTYGCSQNPNM